MITHKALGRRKIERRALPWGIFSSWGSLCATVFCELCTSAEARALSFSVENNNNNVGFGSSPSNPGRILRILDTIFKEDQRSRLDTEWKGAILPKLTLDVFYRHMYNPVTVVRRCT